MVGAERYILEGFRDRYVIDAELYFHGYRLQ